MIYQLIENLARLIMEWAIDKQLNERPIVDEVHDRFSYHPPKKLLKFSKT